MSSMFRAGRSSTNGTSPSLNSTPAPSQASSIVNSSFQSVSSVASQNTTQNQLTNALAVEKSLEKLVGIFKQPGFMLPLFPRASSEKYIAVAESFDRPACIRITQRLLENLTKVRETQVRYLTALEKLLEDACQPVDLGGLEEEHLHRIYERLCDHIDKAAETALRIKVAEFIEKTLHEQDEAAKAVDLDETWSQEVRKSPENFADILEKKMQQLRTELPGKLAQRKLNWIAILDKRHIDVARPDPEPVEEGDLFDSAVDVISDGETEPSAQQDFRDDASMNSEGEIDGLPDQATRIDD